MCSTRDLTRPHGWSQDDPCFTGEETEDWREEVMQVTVTFI